MVIMLLVISHSKCTVFLLFHEFQEFAVASPRKFAVYSFISIKKILKTICKNENFFVKWTLPILERPLPNSQATIG